VRTKRSRRICREQIASARCLRCTSEASTKRRVKKRTRERAGQLVDIYLLSRVFLFFFVSPRDARRAVYLSQRPWESGSPSQAHVSLTLSFFLFLSELSW